MNRKTLIALAAALAFGLTGAVTSAQAGDRDDGPSGGYSIGPLGQRLGGDTNGWGWRDTGPNAYGYAPAPRDTGPNASGYVPAPAHHGHKHLRAR
jgi:hypothetical protein